MLEMALAPKIDVKSLDEKLENLHRLYSMKKKKELHDEESNKVINMRAMGTKEAPQEEWQMIIREKLVVKQVFARGGFGSVHKGIYDGQEVAVKVMEWGEDGRTKSEIASLKKDFRQECIGATTDTDYASVITEYLSGGTLKAFLIQHRKKKLSLKTVNCLAVDLTKGLSFLHSKNIVHRDVKTENVLLDKDGRVKIADFGVARLEASNLAEMTGYTGTPRYMAPEVLECKPYNRKCDVYSFGICLWEMYCCDMPYPNITFSELTSAVVYKNLRPEIPKQCPSSLAKVMKQCWDGEPKRRPEMEEVVSMLEAINTSNSVPSGCFSCFGSRR
ncbi:Protein kinase superfamily protein [Prunus dulcis]|uniref:Protein kinase superfamily protein n=1 Tax=Prunus dulcis TaxID=3755 RepID=A0A4Y1QQK6_PRUDU|nr:Protein kinase superfamily protein [Prunus dulcis]